MRILLSIAIAEEGHLVRIDLGRIRNGRLETGSIRDRGGVEVEGENLEVAESIRLIEPVDCFKISMISK